MTISMSRMSRMNAVTFALVFVLALFVFDSPSLSGADLIYNGDFESGNLSGWNVQDGGLPGAAGVQTEIVRAGNFAAKLHIEKCSWNSINNSGPTCGQEPVGVDRPRSQLILSKRVDFDLEKEFWVGASIYIPEDWIFDNPSNTNDNVLQAVAATSGGPGAGTSPQPWNLRLLGNRWNFSNKGEAAPVTSQQNVMQFHQDVGKVERGVWTDWVFNFKFSYTDGFVNVWKDGEQVYARTGSTMTHNLVGGNPTDLPPFLNAAIYKPQWFNGESKPEVTERTVYHDEIRIATGANGYDLVSPPVLVPEPGSALLCLLAAGCFGLARRRRSQIDR